MAAWPELSELVQILNVEGTDAEDWQPVLARALGAAIARVKRDVGRWDETSDEPDDALAQAALRLAELIATRPGTPVERLTADATYRTLMVGQRRRFGIS